MQRIDHGNACLDDAGAGAGTRRDGVPLTVCPLSNLKLQVVPSMEAHPLQRADGRRPVRHRQLGRPVVLRRLRQRQLPGLPACARAVARRHGDAGAQQLRGGLHPGQRACGGAGPARCLGRAAPAAEVARERRGSADARNPYRGARACARPSASNACTRPSAPRTARTSSRCTTSSFDVGQGEFVTVVGPSGCGKSTLLRILAGLERASDGTRQLGGKPVTGPSRDVGVVFQSPVLLPWRSVLENVLVPAQIQGRDLKIAARARHALPANGRPGGLRDQVPERAVRRHAAAGRHCPRPGQRPACCC